MGNGTEDKAERILTIYTKLKQRKIIYKDALIEKYGVSARTVQRDITDIQEFLQSQFMEEGNIQEIVFDKRAGGYRLQIKQTNELNGKAVLAACKILLESRALAKTEMLPILYSLTALCDTDSGAADVKDMLGNEIQNYTELRHGQKLLDRIWDLEQAVKAHKYTEVTYKTQQDHGRVTEKIKPVGIVLRDFYFYLVAYGAEEDSEKNSDPKNVFPVFYRVDKIQEYTVMEEYFRVPYAGRYEESEFRKRIPFVQSGALRKVEFQYVGKVLESVLDRLPSATVIQKDQDGYLIEAEAFGPRIERWLKGQGDNVKNLQVI